MYQHLNKEAQMKAAILECVIFGAGLTVWLGLTLNEFVNRVGAF
jgi:hypothetical protein